MVNAASDRPRMQPRALIRDADSLFHLTQILPGDSVAELQAAIAKSYSSKGQEQVERNWQALAPGVNRRVPLQPVTPVSPNRPPVVSDAARRISSKQLCRDWLAGLGDALPVSLCRRTAPGPSSLHPLGETHHRRRVPSGRKRCVLRCICVAACPHGDPAPKWSPRKRWRTPLPACIQWM